MSKSNFIVRGGADFSQIKQEMDKTQKQFKGFKSTLSSGLSTLGKLTGITLGTAALVNFGKQAIKTSSDLEEIQNVTDTVFGSMAKDIDNFSKGLIESHGMGELSAKKYASYMGAMLKSSGIQGEAVKNMSKDIALLTADMASFYNLETDEMFQKLMSGMSGQSMPLKQLGINMNIANLEAFALSQGIRESWQEMNQAEQVMLRYNYLMAVTGDAQGDFARNSWNWAHSVKILGEKWQEFLGIVGKGLQVVVLPLVKGLTKVLDVLIKIAKSIGEVYTMITGKEVSVDTKSNTSLPDEKEMGPMLDLPKINKDIGKTGGKAAKGEKDLGKGIDKAAKAAKKALAPFDELNILQRNLIDNINGGKSPGGSGSGGGKGLGGFDDGINNMVGNMENSMKTKKTTDDMKSNFDSFFTWFMNKWKKLKQTLEIPIKVPAPAFAKIPSPVYNPDWGLNPPLVPIPLFPPIPIPVYEPDWGLTPPLIPQLAFPPLLHEEYDLSLETVKTLTAGAYENIKVKTGELKTNVATQWQQMNERVQSESETMRQKLATTWGAIGANYQAHRQNMGVISAGIATVMAANAARGVTTSGRNQNAGLSAMQRSMLAFGRNIGTVAAGASMALARNLGSGLNAGVRNFNSFFRSTRPAMQSWASGLLRMSADWGRSFVSNIASALSTAWRNIKSFASSTGGKLKGWYSENKGTVAKTAIVAGGVLAAGTIALAFPASIPFVAGGLAGLTSVPALAKGGITNGEMLALVGDNPGGREVVSPLDDLMEMIQIVVNESGSNGNGDMYLTVKLGEDTIREELISGFNRQSRANGESVLEI